MWVYLPKQCIPSHFFPVQEGLTSDSISPFQRLASSVTSNKMRMPARYWQLAWKKRPYLQRLSGAMLAPSEANRGVERFIASLGDSHVSSQEPLSTQNEGSYRLSQWKLETLPSLTSVDGVELPLSCHELAHLLEKLEVLGFWIPLPQMSTHTIPDKSFENGTLIKNEMKGYLASQNGSVPKNLTAATTIKTALGSLSGTYYLPKRQMTTPLTSGGSLGATLPMDGGYSEKVGKTVELSSAAALKKRPRSGKGSRQRDTMPPESSVKVSSNSILLKETSTNSLAHSEPMHTEKPLLQQLLDLPPINPEHFTWDGQAEMAPSMMDILKPQPPAENSLLVWLWLPTEHSVSLPPYISLQLERPALSKDEPMHRDPNLTWMSTSTIDLRLLRVSTDGSELDPLSQGGLVLYTTLASMKMNHTSLTAQSSTTARTSQELGNRQGSMDPKVGSGESLQGLLAKYDPVSCSLKMSQRSLFPGLDEFSGTLPASGTMRNGACRARPVSEHLTSVDDCSYWPTPTATPYGSSQNGINGKGGANERPSAGTLSLENQARALRSTPTVKGNYMVKGQGSTTGDGIATPALRWNTPRSRDYKQGGKDCLTSDIQNFRPSSPQGQEKPSSGLEFSQSTQTSPPRLNPRFVEWMMNWPQNWTSTKTIEARDCDALETEWCRWLRLSRSSISRLGWVYNGDGDGLKKKQRQP